MSEVEMYGDTPATSPDPESGAEGDTNQLEQEDTLIDRGVDSPLDESYSPPERPLSYTRLETELEQSRGETFDEKLAREVPDVWSEDYDTPAEADRAGRLASYDDALDGRSEVSVFASDVGISGGAASAEEAAMHVTDEP